MSRRYLSGALVALLLAATPFGAAQAQETSTAATSETKPAAEASTPATPEVLEMALGQEDAPLEVIEYASFTCPHCQSFHENVFDEIKKNYVDTGKVRFVYREVYFDRYGLWAGMVARCAGPERYFGLTDILYDKQKEWLEGNDPAVIADNLRRIGRSAGLTDEKLEACLSDGAKAQAMVATYQENAKKDDINSTPSFVIDGKKYSNMNYADFSKLLDEKLAD
ncbi:thiol-disulfide oxidoreductase [Brevirhabdus pacifica]|uniref:Thiol-disulfide oxidoreductase n=1 Tax=Brevirhabdus pacifica TaxID=1267768 RepID=A0A1U7DIQ9_9RHOB|nr:DsbA family protein [Brevirhabdus pacifica]APX89758.1 thiol-disulfide oxidoreductase [Brevirhabdus pacifica]OWU74593.1 thiol-disulfide oxidoreductase [Loktanella sp. 22II-4b]PJJ85550.1 protein-disulfide isomerase [Brevirhabdus pacifica]